MMDQKQIVTVRTNNNTGAMETITQCWANFFQGNYALTLNSVPGYFPIASYSNYQSNETGDYDFTIMLVNNQFQNEMQQLQNQGLILAYDETSTSNNISECSQNAWQKVWNDQKANKIKRSFKIDYEWSIPGDLSSDGQAHCYLFISI